jgi:hypothetical protein
MLGQVKTCSVQFLFSYNVHACVTAGILRILFSCRISDVMEGNSDAGVGLGVGGEEKNSQPPPGIES